MMDSEGAYRFFDCSTAKRPNALVSSPTYGILTTTVLAHGTF